MDHNPTLSELPILQEHPVYLKGMAQISAGQWRQAVESFQLLQSLYPREAEIKELLREAQMRDTFTQFQSVQKGQVRQRSPLRWLVVGLLVVVILIAVGYGAYEFWISPVILQELRVRQITSLRSQADEAIAAGDYTLARQNLEQLQAILPEDPETMAMLRRIEGVEKLSSLYNEAKALMAAGNWDQAVETLTRLQSLDEHYRDLPQLLQTAHEFQALDQQFQAAEKTFAAEDWPTAISQYEALQQTNLTFRFEEIQARLFESHLKYGQTILESEGGDTSDQAAKALAHFAEALKLRPIDAEALNQRKLAESYVAALTSADQDEAIDLLQAIYKQQPDYAGQKVAQLLYTTLLNRAAAHLAANNKEAAISDYQIAAKLQIKDPSEAQQKLAELN